MAVMSSATRTALLEKKEALETRIENAWTALDSAVAQRSKRYTFDSMEGSQSETFKSVEEWTELIEYLERQLDYIDRRLNGRIVMNMRNRRKQGRTWGLNSGN